MKIIYLLPPSEGKNAGGKNAAEKLSFHFEKPAEIAINATQKDLKCKGTRYEEGIELNTSLLNSGSAPAYARVLSSQEREAAVSSSPGGEELRGDFMPAIQRYSGVMYNAIDYAGMSSKGKKYFEENFIILSGMYGLVKPLDTIGNYKLPIETKGLYKYWDNTITQALDDIGADYIVNMLPGSYAKMIDWKELQTQVITTNFLHHKDGQLKKITHGVKKVKGEYIKNICEDSLTTLKDFPGVLEKKSDWEYNLDIVS